MADPRLQAQLDAAARQKGFKDYSQYQAWDRNTRQVVMQGNVEAPPQTNWLQNLLSSIPGHPAQTLGYVHERMKKALGR